MDIKEPFKQLQTQGMISHETYKSEAGKWLSPDDIVKNDAGAWIETATNKPVTVGRIEKMSKSKKNTIDPRHIIDTYGVDAARLFMLSDSPPERDLEWTDAGIEGAWRYLNRVWRLTQNVLSTKHQAPSTDIQKLTHKTIAAVTDDIEKFHFNKAIARIRELTNALEQSKGDIREGLEAALHLMQPFMPHIAEECWQQLGHKDPLYTRAWPKADAALTVDDSVTVAIQINGKMKGTIELPKDLDKTLAEQKVLELAAIKEALADKKINKVIVVPNRIVNVVAN